MFDSSISYEFFLCIYWNIEIVWHASINDTVEIGVDDAIDPITEAPAAEELDVDMDYLMVREA